MFPVKATLGTKSPTRTSFLSTRSMSKRWENDFTSRTAITLGLTLTKKGKEGGTLVRNTVLLYFSTRFLKKLSGFWNQK